MIIILLGIIQGFTEPLPISSSGHLYLISKLFNLKTDNLSLEIIVNFGSLLAVLFYYKSKIKLLLKGTFNYVINRENKSDFLYFIRIVTGTIPAVIIGGLFKDYIEKYINSKLIGIAFIITSLLLFLIKDKKGEKNNISFIDSIIIGFYQVLALVPGISRSASTIVGCMNQNLDRDTSFDYSFMLYIPVSLGSFILSIKDFSFNITYVFSIILSAFFTYISLILFSKAIKNGKLIIFSIYTLIIGLISFFII